MSLGKLTALQERVLILLADIAPPWTLTGGAALAGFHTMHRETRDLDLFFRGHANLGVVVRDVTTQLAAAGLTVGVLRTSPTFAQLDVRDADAAVVIDLVAATILTALGIGDAVEEIAATGTDGAPVDISTKAALRKADTDGVDAALAALAPDTE
jgi:hypothetical protein